MDRVVASLTSQYLAIAGFGAAIALIIAGMVGRGALILLLATYLAVVV